MSANATAAGGDVPDGDRVHECRADDCEAWRYSRLALEFHVLREHSVLVGGLTDG